MSETTTSPTLSSALRRLYFVRFGFAVVWAALLFLTGGTMGPFLTILLIAYPLFDAASVFWQIRAEGESRRTKVSEWINVVVSVLVAIALGWASTVSPSVALTVWGVWAIGAGLPQLITAIRNRRSGGQVPQMLSGGISLFAGGAFVAQGLQGSEMIVGVAGYAVLGAVFFLVSAVRLTVVLRKTSAG
ncbi:hypothetical protein ABS642_13305 [Microbacterium sp. A8/3-1]|uniref:Uncharacterized protein n=1 Tax=Microbacterium sp. A8/3-1 TaxID=3160749 RepID=A0AAU7VUA9_9MICO